MTGDHSALLELTLQLSGLGVQLPENLDRAAGQLLRLPSFRARPIVPDKLIGLTDAEMSEAMFDLGVGYALDGSHGPGAQAADHMTLALQAAVADEYLRCAGDIIDQLRPAFSEAAGVVHGAVQLGIHPGTTDRDVVKADDIVKVRDAWTAIPAAIRRLGAIASARIALSRATGAPPAPRRRQMDALREPAIEDVAGAMFREDAPPYSLGAYEKSEARWLRLAANGKLRLLSLEECAAAAGQGRDAVAAEVDA